MRDGRGDGPAPLPLSSRTPALSCIVGACTVYSVPLCTLPRRQRSRPARPRPAHLLIALSPPAGLLSSTAARRAPCHERARSGACLQTIGTSDLRLVNRDRGPPQGVSARSPTDATRALAVLSLLLLLPWSSYQLRLVPRFSLCPLPVNARQASSSSPFHCTLLFIARPVALVLLIQHSSRCASPSFSRPWRPPRRPPSPSSACPAARRSSSSALTRSFPPAQSLAMCTRWQAAAPSRCRAVRPLRRCPVRVREETETDPSSSSSPLLALPPPPLSSSSFSFSCPL